MMHMIRYTSSSGTVALGLLQNGQLIGHFPPNVDLHHLLRGSADELRAQIEQSTQPGRTTHAVSSLLAPSTVRLRCGPQASPTSDPTRFAKRRAARRIFTPGSIAPNGPNSSSKRTLGESLDQMQPSASVPTQAGTSQSQSLCSSSMPLPRSSATLLAMM